MSAATVVDLVSVMPKGVEHTRNRPTTTFGRGTLPESDMARFLEFWQGRRDGARPSIVEVIA